VLHLVFNPLLQPNRSTNAKGLAMPALMQLSLDEELDKERSLMQKKTPS